MDYQTILVAAGFAALYQLAAHYFPWEMWLLLVPSKKPPIGICELPRPAAYIIGNLGILLPTLFVLWQWGSIREMILVIAITISSGMAVLLSRMLDWVRNRLVKQFEMEERYVTEEAQGRSPKAGNDPTQRQP